MHTYNATILHHDICHNIKGKGKGRCIALMQRTPHRATEHHLPYGITQCYLPPNRDERAPP